MSATAAPRLLNRRHALRLAFAAVPVAAVALSGGTANAATAPVAATATGTVKTTGTAPTAGTAAARKALIPGTYRPDATTTGPVPGTALKQVQGDLTATANNQIIENQEIFGSINLKSFTGVTIRNCVIWGTLATGVDTAHIIFAGDNGRGAIIEDTRINGRGNVWCSAIRGGNYTMRRTEITNTPDGICLTSAIGNVTVEASWIHNGFFQEWTATTPNMPYAGAYYTHVDGVQFHRGKNYTFRGNMIGGSSYNAKHHTGHLADIRGADDMYNSAFMIKQEVDNTPANRIENVLIENNWLAGGQATLNLTTGNDNTFATTIIRNNRFIRSTTNPNQLYILSGANLGKLTNNVFDDNGAPVTISKGY